MAQFSLYLPLLTQVEGGFQKNPKDRGNYNSKGELVGTNLGISAPVYEAYIGFPPNERDMLNITKDVAASIFKDWFWDRIGATQIKSQSVANIIVDHGVNAGLASIGRIVQRILNRDFNFLLAVDGAIGVRTRAAINSVDAEQLHELIKKSREQFYRSLNNSEFEDGWLIRLKKFVFEKKSLIGIGFFIVVIGGFLILRSKNGRA